MLGFPVDVAFPEDSFNFGVIELSTEFSRIFVFDNGPSVMPYAEIGATYVSGCAQRGLDRPFPQEQTTTGDWL